MQIQKLEEDLGVVLFDRSKKPILLTEAGKKAIDQIQTVLFEAKKIQELAKSSGAGEERGSLMLGVIPTVAPYVLPRLLPVLSAHWPELELTIRELQTHRILEALDQDEIDVGLLATPVGVPRMFEFPLFYEPFSVLCQKSSALARKRKIAHDALDPSDLWLLEEGHCMRNQVLDVCAMKRGKAGRHKFNFESGSLETLKSLVSTTGGVTLLPRLATDRIAANTSLVEFERPIPARQIGLVHRREHYKGELIEALGDAILKCIPEDVRKIRPKDLEVLPVG
jgi:LysR family hydrogen peroxide-inducible transcriptional activator